MKKFIFKLVNKQTLSIIFIIAIVAILLAIISFYRLNGFNLNWFIFLHLPLYLFSIWALYNSWKLFKQCK